MSFQLHLKDLYRTTVVERWNIVEVSRRQSVAEHQYLVSLLVVRYCQLKGLHRGVETQALRFALLHDAAEVLTGDVPTPTKEHCGPGLERVEADTVPLGEDPLAVPQKVEEVVNFCDKVEAFVWLAKYGVDDHAHRVKEAIREKLYKVDPVAAKQLFHECLELRDTVLWE